MPCRSAATGGGGPPIPWRGGSPLWKAPPPPARPERIAGLGVAVLVAIAGASGAWAAKPTPHVIVKPDWVIKPKSADLVDAYPPEAAKSGVGGAATIGCAVSA